MSFLTHSVQFPSLQADFTIHIIHIFLVAQPRICFEPRLKKLCSLHFADFAWADSSLSSLAFASSLSIAVAAFCS